MMVTDLKQTSMSPGTRLIQIAKTMPQNSSFVEKLRTEGDHIFRNALELFSKQDKSRKEIVDNVIRDLLYLKNVLNFHSRKVEKAYHENRERIEQRVKELNRLGVDMGALEKSHRVNLKDAPRIQGEGYRLIGKAQIKRGLRFFSSESVEEPRLPVRENSGIDHFSSELKSVISCCACAVAASMVGGIVGQIITNLIPERKEIILKLTGLKRRLYSAKGVPPIEIQLQALRYMKEWELNKQGIVFKRERKVLLDQTPMNGGYPEQKILERRRDIPKEKHPLTLWEIRIPTQTT